MLVPVVCMLLYMTSPVHAAYTVPSDDTVVITADGGSSLMLKFCSSSVVKVYYSFDGGFSTEAPTPAVVSESLEPVGISVNEDDVQYEIMTGALRIAVDKSPLRIRVFDKYQKLIVSDAPEAYAKSDGVISCEKILPRDEHIFGLGEKAGLMDRRGGYYTMWNSDKPCYCIDEDPLYKSIPFFMSTKGYGIFFDNSYKTHFDFGNEKRDRYVFSAEGGEMIYYIIVGDDYKDILHKYVQLTGAPVLPPKWALGFSQCRGLYTREKQALEVGAKFRSLGIPCDVIYQDIGWVESLQNFRWQPRNYHNPKAMLSTLKSQGFHVVISQDPVVSQRNREQWEEADRMGIFAKDVRTGKTYDMPWPWGGRCGIVDFTDPKAASWWGDLQQKPIDDGVSGFWTDMGEPAWSNEEEPDRLNIEHYAGSHAKIHNVYGLYWDRVVTQEFEKRNPDKRLFQMTRAAFAGMQRYCFSWTGDSGSSRGMADSWEQFAYQIPMMLSAGLCGVPFITGDITGYCGEIKDYSAVAELYVRWMQFGLFTPLSRAHHEGDTAVEPWMFGDQAMEYAKKAIELKYSLLPYIYTCAREAYDTGLPLMRAMFLEFPDDKECRNLDMQFMFGDRLLVAPVTKKGVTTWSLYLPEGGWYDYYSGKYFKGGRYIDVDAPLDKVPLFVKAGTVLPTMPVQQYVSENPDADLYIDIWPEEGCSDEYVLYEDDGESLQYKNDCCARTKFGFTYKDGVCDIVSGGREFSGGYGFAPQRDVIVRFHGDLPVKKLTVNGENVRRSRIKDGQISISGL